jgi:PIN like domain
MLRASGWDLVTMHEHYGKASAQTVDDVIWIGELSAQGFALLTSDARIVRNKIEANAIVEAGAVVFMLPKGDMTSDEMARRFEIHRPAIDFRAALGGPAGYALYERIVSQVFP